MTTLPAFCAFVMKSGNLNFLEPSGPLQACNRTALPFFAMFCRGNFLTKMGIVIFYGATGSSGSEPLQCRGFTMTLRHTTFGRTPLGEWSYRRGDLHLTTHNNHKRHTSMPTAGFEFTIPAVEQTQTHALDRAATDRLNTLLPTEIRIPLPSTSAIYS